MRYANVLLMKAEALNEQGHPEQAIPLINEVRSVHGDMPPMTGTSQEAVRAQIEHERMIEFPLENYRWYDLRRWANCPQPCKLPEEQASMKTKTHSTPLLLQS